MEATVREVERVTTLELFFDLVFVFTITQLTAVVYHDPSAQSLLQVVLMLGVIYWMHGGYAWMRSRRPSPAADWRSGSRTSSSYSFTRRSSCAPPPRASSERSSG